MPVEDVPSVLCEAERDRDDRVAETYVFATAAVQSIAVVHLPSHSEKYSSSMVASASRSSRSVSWDLGGTECSMVKVSEVDGAWDES